MKKNSKLLTLTLTREAYLRLNELFANNVLTSGEVRIVLQLLEWPRGGGNLALETHLYGVAELDDTFGPSLIAPEETT